jgi:hypothetical protein
MIRHTRTGIIVALAAFAPASYAGNVISNPDFSQWLLGWSFPSEEWIGNIEADFDEGAPAPPSAHVYGNADHPNSAIASPCVAMDASEPIDFSFEARVAAGVATGAVVAYTDTACTAMIGTIPTTLIEPSDDWHSFSISGVSLPGNTQSVQFAFYAQYGASPFADAYVDHVAVGPAGTLPAAIPIDQWGLTGAWYDPDESGQGFQLTFDPIEGTLFGAWYTFDTASGGTDTQRWYSLQATLASDDVSADVTIYRNTGGTFDGPPTTTAVPVGSGTLAFDSCTSGTFAYTMDDGRKGAIRVRTLFPQSQCDEGGHPVVEPGPPGISGTWYDPSTAGQGVMITIDPFDENVFVGWYTYAAGVASEEADGQRWFSAQGNYGMQGSPVALTLYESTGGAFDAGDPVSTVEVGSATLNFASCESATLDYTFTRGDLAGRSGSLPLTRLGATPESCALSNPN